MARGILEIIFDMIWLVIDNTFGTIVDLTILFVELFQASVFYFETYGFVSLLVTAPTVGLISWLFLHMVWKDGKKEIKLLITAGAILFVLIMLGAR